MNEVDRRLAPCPFCGTNKYSSVQTNGDLLGWASACIVCALCDCHGPNIIAVTDEEIPVVVDMAINEWNRRQHLDVALREANAEIEKLRVDLVDAYESYKDLMERSHAEIEQLHGELAVAREQGRTEGREECELVLFRIREWFLPGEWEWNYLNDESASIRARSRKENEE